MKNSHIFPHFDSINIRSNETIFLNEKKRNIFLGFFLRTEEEEKPYVTNNFFCHSSSFQIRLFARQRQRNSEMTEEKKKNEILFALRIK